MSEGRFYRPKTAPIKPTEDEEDDFSPSREECEVLWFAFALAVVSAAAGVIGCLR